MGEVYRARDTKLDREVAIKVLPNALARDPERMARFEREAKVLASLNHPHIATIDRLAVSSVGRARACGAAGRGGRLARGALPAVSPSKGGDQVCDCVPPQDRCSPAGRPLSITRDGWSGLP